MLTKNPAFAGFFVGVRWAVLLVSISVASRYGVMQSENFQDVT
jgi:hypothetical protein